MNGIETVKNFDELNDGLKYYNIKSFVTGSYLYGLHGKDSDFDICVRNETAIMLRNYLTEKIGIEAIEKRSSEKPSSENEENEKIEKIDDSFTGNGFYCKFPFGTVNFIALHKEQYENWYLATKSVVFKLKNEEFKEFISTKENRVNYFRGLRKALHWKI